MGDRGKAIAQILDEGADMTDENINAVMKSIDTDSDEDTEKIIGTIRKKMSSTGNKRAQMEAINKMGAEIGDKLDQVIDTVNRPVNVNIPEIKVPDVHIPEIKVPDIHMPEQNLIHPPAMESNKKITRATPHRDVNGFVEYWDFTYED